MEFLFSSLRCKKIHQTSLSMIPHKGKFEEKLLPKAFGQQSILCWPTVHWWYIKTPQTGSLLDLVVIAFNSRWIVPQAMKPMGNV